MSAHGNGAAPNGHSSLLTDERKLADLVGWASVGLGVPQATSPGRFDRFIGIRPDTKPRC